MTSWSGMRTALPAAPSRSGEGFFRSFLVSPDGLTEELRHSKPDGFSCSGPSARRDVKRLTRKGFHAEMSGQIKLTFCYNGRDTAIRTRVSRRRR